MIKMCDTSRFHPHAYVWGISWQLLKAKSFPILAFLRCLTLMRLLFLVRAQALFLVF